MKKFLKICSLAFAVTLCFSSCEKENVRTPAEPTTYTFYYTADEMSEYGYKLDITLFEYNEKDEIVSQKTIQDCRTGHRQDFTANNLSEKVKVYASVSYESKSVYFWVQQVYYLTKNTNTFIEVNGTTRIGGTEP